VSAAWEQKVDKLRHPGQRSSTSIAFCALLNARIIPYLLKREKERLVIESLSWNKVSPKQKQMNLAYKITGLQLQHGSHHMVRLIHLGN